MKLPPEIVGGVAAGIAVLLVLMVVFRYLLRICRPNEILIFSGRKHTTAGRAQGRLPRRVRRPRVPHPGASRRSIAWTCR